jgi:hypothetical protein
MTNFTIRTAYSYSPKFKSYIVAAYVLETEMPGLPKNHSYKTLATYAVDDTKHQAQKEAIERILKDNTRHPVDMPIEEFGRVTFDQATNYRF